jgi:D-3-phosphoglycerate dehydrogenase
VRALRPSLLFTAPHDFLPSLSPLIDHFAATFREVWTSGDLPPDEGFRYWIPNPGQHFVITRSVLDRYPELTAIATPSTGTNHIDRPACDERGVALFSLLDDRAALEEISASAEFTFLHVLNALRRLDVGLRAVERGEWRDDERRFRGHQLAGRRVGLVGCGRIGRRLARYFAAFGCRVMAYDPHAALPEGVRRIQSLGELFGLNDIVVVCCALTDETAGLIGEDLLRRLPTGAVFVNTSRGEVLREEELLAVLEVRRDLLISADVVTGEVDGSYVDSALFQAAREGRALVTPHVAGATLESQYKAATVALQLLDGYARRSLQQTVRAKG